MYNQKILDYKLFSKLLIFLLSTVKQFLGCRPNLKINISSNQSFDNIGVVFRISHLTNHDGILYS